MIRIILIVLVVLPSLLQAQEHSLKLHTNFLLFNADNFPKAVDYKPMLINYHGLAFAYRKVNKSLKIQQLEAKVQFRKVNNEIFEFQSTSYHLKYEFGKYLKRLSRKKFRTSILGGTKVFYQFEDIKREDIFEIPLTNEYYGINLSFLGNIEYKLTENFFVELGLQIIGATLYADRTTLKFDPIRKLGGFGISCHDQLMRFGLGYVFSPKKPSEAINK